MRRKVPQGAFDYYLSLGRERSYRAVAKWCGVAKQTITKVAVREQWQIKIAEIEAKARDSSVQQTVENLEQMTQRHLQTLKVIQGKALQALKSMPLTTAMEAVRALDMCIGKERLIRGEPSDRTAVSIEQTIRTEYERWMGSNGVATQRGDESDAEHEDGGR